MNTVPEHPPEKKPAVLVIEDDPFMAQLLQFVLERQQLQVTCVSDGREAMSLLEQDASFDAVVLDLMLPQVSGMDVLSRMRQLPRWSRTAVLVLSALDGGEEIARAFRIGANDYLCKPFNPDELMARLQRLMPAQANGV